MKIFLAGIGTLKELNHKCVKKNIKIKKPKFLFEWKRVFLHYVECEAGMQHNRSFFRTGIKEFESQLHIAVSMQSFKLTPNTQWKLQGIIKLKVFHIYD